MTAGRVKGEPCAAGHHCCLVGCEHTHLKSLAECPRCTPQSSTLTEAQWERAAAIYCRERDAALTEVERLREALRACSRDAATVGPAKAYDTAEAALDAGPPPDFVLAKEGQIGRLEARAQSAEAEVERLHAALIDAAAGLDEALDYVDDYFIAKWDLDGYRVRAKEALEVRR